VERRGGDLRAAGGVSGAGVGRAPTGRSAGSVEGWDGSLDVRMPGQLTCPLGARGTGSSSPKAEPLGRASACISRLRHPPHRPPKSSLNP